jgi:phosphatidylinositol alpha-1,6-mannosyltransferase
MKSLLISSIYFPPQVGGISKVMASIASALGSKQVCCLTGVPLEKSSACQNFLPKVYRRPGAFIGRRYLKKLKWGATISEITIRERPRILQLATAYEGYQGLWLHRWLKLPFVVYAHGNEILDALRGDREKMRLALQSADKVLANSRFTASLVEKTGVDPSRIETVYLGCDTDHFRLLPPRLELRQKLLGSRYRDRVILTVGNLVSRKGHDIVIRAIARLRETAAEVTYLVVGDGPYRRTLETMVTSLGVGDRVIFAGYISDTDLPSVYALCDVFVMPSRDQSDSCDIEGFGLVFLEANACGKAVIGGRSGGIPEAIVDGVTGFLVNPKDPEDVANALRRLLTDNELALRMGHHGRLRVVNDFTWTKCGKRVQEILEGIISNKSA